MTALSRIASCTRTRASSVGTRGRDPIRRPAGGSSVTEIADGPDGLTRRSLDEAGEPVRGQLGAHATRLREPQEQSSVEAFDEAGHPVTTNEGWHRRVVTWGARGCLVRIELFAIDGARASDARGMSRREGDCDVFGNVERVRSFDDRGRLAPSSGGGESERFAYDERGNLVSQVSASTEDVTRWVQVTHRWDALGRKIVTDQPGLRVLRSYDQLDRVVDEPRTTPALRELPMDRKLFQWDERGRLSEVSRVDREGALPASGVAAVRRSHDAFDRLIEETTVDREGRLVDAPDSGFARARIDWESGEEPLHRFFAASGAEMSVVGGRRMCTSHDPRAREGPFSETSARARAQAAITAIAAGARWTDAVRGRADDGHGPDWSGDPFWLATAKATPETRALEAIRVGELTPVLDEKNRHCVFRRLR